MNDGIIKFECDWLKAKPLELNLVKELNRWREKMYCLELIGAYPSGIGYGNISVRFKGDQFIITGSETGRLKSLTPAHYTLVTSVDIDRNKLSCNGPIKASSESLSHAACYFADKDIRAVIHVHSKKIWHELLNKAMTTGKDATYGTPEMAYEITRLIKNNPFKNLIIMAGHEEGIISYGRSLKGAADEILKYV